MRHRLQFYSASASDTSSRVEMADQAISNTPASTRLTPKFLSLGDGNEILQVAFAPGDSIFAAELAFSYRGIGLRSEIQPVGAVERALGW